MKKKANINAIVFHREFNDYSYIISFKRLSPLLLCASFISFIFFLFSVIGYTGIFRTNKSVNTFFLITVGLFFMLSSLLYFLFRRIFKKNSEEAFTGIAPRILFYATLFIVFYGSIIVSSFNIEAVTREATYVFICLIFAIAFYLSVPVLILLFMSSCAVNLVHIVINSKENIFFPYHIISSMIMAGVGLFFSLMLYHEREEFYMLLKNFLIKNRDTMKSFSKKFGFTAREFETVTLLIEGFTYRIIAEKMNISEHTVKTYAVSIYQKAAVSGKVQLVNLIKDNSMK